MIKNHCRKSSKSYSKVCTFFISHASSPELVNGKPIKQGLAICSFCNRGFDEE
jgi:hypothetical protein